MSKKITNDQYAKLVNEALTRMDSQKNGGNGDGKVTAEEALNDLHIGNMLSGLEEDSPEYTKLKSLTDKIPDVLKQYAGDDGIFDNNEWTAFLNGEEWGSVLDTYHSTKKFAQIEMNMIDGSKNSFKNKKCTKGEIKVGILNNMRKRYPDVDCSNIEKIIDKYAGPDGTFSTDEYMALKNDPVYSEFLKKYNVTPFE